MNARTLVIAWLVAAAACGKGDKPPPPSTANLTQETGPAQGRPPGSGANGPSEAERTFVTVCSKCHGVDGAGNGEVAAKLDPKPRNYTDPKWQASTTDDEIRNIILLGGAGVGKSAMMPPSPALKDRPQVVDGLVRIIRGFATK